jgi:hypothetical protein
VSLRGADSCDATPSRDDHPVLADTMLLSLGAGCVRVAFALFSVLTKGTEADWLYIC